MNKLSIRKAEFYKFFWQAILLNTAAMLFIIGFDVFTIGWGSAFYWGKLLSTFVYSNCIGTLICIIISVFARRSSGKSYFIQSAKIIPLIFLVTFVGLMVGNIILSPLRGSIGILSFLPGLKGFGSSLIISFVYASSLFFYESSRVKLAETEKQLRQKQIDEIQTRILITEAQLASLEARIHPHFLFNTLNSIAALVREEPALAETMVEKLSSLLRYSLETNTQKLVCFEQELKITCNYLEIEKVRFEDRLYYKIDFDSRFDKVKVPPLSLQTLAENSIKHVASKRSSKTEIFLSGKESGLFLEIDAADSGDGFDESDIREGHGIDNLRKRLQTIFGRTAHLEIIKNKSKGLVRLKIPLIHE